MGRVERLLSLSKVLAVLWLRLQRAGCQRGGMYLVPLSSPTRVPDPPQPQDSPQHPCEVFAGTPFC